MIAKILKKIQSKVNTKWVQIDQQTEHQSTNGQTNRYMFTMIILITILMMIGQQFSFQQPSLNISDIPGPIYAGQIHYSRIPYQYWQHRIQTIKAMGLNSLSVYVIWNFHEQAQDIFDYVSEGKNLSNFIELAKKYNMSILIRPGPYVCAEWDFGGLPARLLAVPNLQIRANNKLFLDQVRKYFKSLVPILQPYLSNKNGPIVMLQIQNQYGFYGSDKSYINALKAIWQQYGIIENYYYVDQAKNIFKSYWKGANIGINGAVGGKTYRYASLFVGKKGLIFAGEIYSGWFTSWGNGWEGKSIDVFLNQYKELLSNNVSFSMYMAHGGSNFALTAGANSYDWRQFYRRTDYCPQVTSYDYDSPLNQQGRPTEKFWRFRQLIGEYISQQIPQPPESIPLINISQFKPQIYGYLFESLSEPTIINSKVLYLFQSNELQMYSQGMALYETNLKHHQNYFRIQVHDFALVYLDGTFIEYLSRSQKKQHQLQVNCSLQQCKLTILVQAMGHIGFGHNMDIDRKGLYYFEDLIGGIQYLWNITTVEVDLKQLLNYFTRKQSSKPSFPTLFKGSLNLSVIGDTYINMSKWKKGYLWVNGHNLGRYWNIGPQHKLYCPGTWLKVGTNQIIILDLLDSESNTMWGQTTLK